MKISFRPLTRQDFPVLSAWLSTQHVAKWWQESSDLAAIEAKYGKRVDGKSATKVFTILADNQPVGMIQSYWVRDYKEYLNVTNLPTAMGLDLFIGDKSLVGHGFGGVILDEFIGHTTRLYVGREYVIASPSIHNQSSIKAFEKSGFERRQTINVPGEKDPEQLMVKTI